ncbi:hypothetical protein L917_12822 [Phytophthora nicotianae]|uniref:Uncharacterized protein n=1 Tax=Phytophthora nicotianae TaxID=4792 RepID=W2KSJ8_PHYNI|nr:hypothetical protein L917_12822 [Phytophthora nicotianae]
MLLEQVAPKQIRVNHDACAWTSSNTTRNIRFRRDHVPNTTRQMPPAPAASVDELAAPATGQRLSSATDL